MADINKIIDELLLELSLTYPFPNMKDKEQVLALMEICDDLGYGYIKPTLYELLSEAEDAKDSSLFPGKFHLGGGYYSSKDGGEAEFKNDKGNLRPVTPEEKAKFDSKNDKTPSVEKPTAPTPKEPSSETPPTDKPKDSPAKIPSPMKAASVVKSKADVLKSKVEKWSEKEKEFFNKGQDKPGSETRRSFGQALKDKAKGARNAIVHGLKHEAHIFKTAAKAVGKVFSEPGGYRSLDKEEKKALVTVGIKVATTALTAAAFGGLAHGAIAFAKHVAMELVPHVVVETIAVGAGKASIFAGADGEDERLLGDFMDSFADNMENMEIPDELMMSIVDSYNQKKTSAEPQSEIIDLNELFSRFLNEEEGSGESKEFPGKFHLGGGYYSSKDGGAAEFKNDKGNLRPLTDKEKAELSNGGGETDDETPDTASMIDTATKELEAKEKETEKDLPKQNPDMVLNDPEASAKSKAMAKAFKAQQSVEKEKRKDDPNYEKELKSEVKAKIESANETLKSRKSTDGESLDSETTDNGSILIGVEHGEEKESTQEVIKLIKSLPKDAKVMFVGEGGVGIDDNDKIDFVGEQAEIRDAFLDHFENGKEVSWDENGDVRNSDSPIFDEIAKTFDGDKDKALASVWTNMIGQGDDLDADDYLTDATKEWIKSEAKKGGSEEFDGEVDWNNLSLEQTEDLYQLNYRDDQNYGESDLSKGQKAFNDYRQKELDRKIKESEEEGYTVIATMGNSHVDLWRNRNKSKKTDFKAQSLRTLQKELPGADKDVFNKESDLDKIPSDKKEEISMKIDELASKAGKGEDFNLCQITVPGTNLYCDDNQGIPREEMPQFKGKPLPGTPSEDLPKDKNGEVDTEPLFKKMLKERGIKTIETELPSDKLKATQSELVGSKVAGMTKALEEDPNNPGITAPIYVSRDGFVIDGHHRWAAVTSAAIKDGKPANMKVIVVDMDIKDAIPMCNQFAEEQGIAAKKADARDGELPAEEPKVTDDKIGAKATTNGGKTLYHIGNGYYSDSPNGDAKYIRVESVVERAIETDHKKWWNLLFNENIEGTVEGGEDGIFKEIPKKDIDVATDAAKENSNVDVATARTNLKISDDIIKKRIAEASKHIDNSEADDSTKEILKDTISKILKGEDVDPANSEIASKWLAVRVGGGNDIGMYIAKTEGDFTSNSREKIQISIDPEKVEDYDTKAEEWNDSMVNKYGLPIRTQTGAYVNKKDWTANKMNKKRKKVKFETSEDGNSVTIEGVTYTKRPVPDKQTLVEQKNLVEQFIKQGSSEEEAKEEARKVISAIERGNAMVDKLSKDGEMEVVDYGPTNTNDNRRKTLKNTIDKTRKSVLKAIKKYSGLSEEEILEKYAELFKSIDEIEKSAPINNPNWDSMSSEEKENASAEYLNKLTDVLQNIRRDKDIASGGPDIAEVLVFMNEIGKGNQAFLPSSSNFPTVDIVSFNEQKNPPQNATPEELAEFYANAYSANSISFIDSDAESIKLGKGGASAGPSKTDGSTFNNEKTKEVLDSMMGSYHAIYGDYPPSKEAVDKAEEDYKAQRAHMIQILIDQGKSPEQAERMVSDVEKKATEGEKSAYQQAKKSYQKSLGEEEMDSEFDRGLKLYNKTGMLFEMMFNEDVKSNNFGNVRFIESGTGARTRISMEVLDGINEKCCVKFNPNPGELKIKGDASGKRKAGINVSFSTWITKCKK